MVRDEAFIAIISHARAANVAPMQKLVGDSVTWFVGDGEGNDYLEAGARHVIESGKLCPSRNAALEAAFKQGKPCVQLSDDLRKVQLAAVLPGAAKPKAIDLTFDDALQILLETTQAIGAKFGGVAPTANAYFFNPNKPVHDRAFIVGDFVLCIPCDLRWDENLKLKEDYDLTMQHIRAFGRVARCNSILATFLHRSNKGGAVDFRTPDREQEAIAYLKSKWGDAIQDNKKRADEILLRLK